MGENYIDEIIKDEFDKHVKPVIKEESLTYFMALTMSHFEKVRRYMWPATHLDFELLTTIDYSEISFNSEVSDIIEITSNNSNRYKEEEILYLTLRTMYKVIWKLDMLLLLHLEECVEKNYKWNYLIAGLAQNKLEGMYYYLTDMPYWLRNEHIGLLHSPPLGLEMRKLLSVEVAMHKANDIQASYRSLGKNKMIFLDFGLYVYLTEWCELVLSGYRIRKYCEENDYSLTEPVKTGAGLFCAIADILANKCETYDLPMMMNFDKHDPLIAKEIVTSQIDFILAHEYGHIIIDEESDDLNDEIRADDVALKWIKNSKMEAQILNKGHDVKLEIENNDIQSVRIENRKVEAIELLFIFYDLYYYVCKERGYKLLKKQMLRMIACRRKNIRQYVNEESPLLVEYADELATRIKTIIDLANEKE